MTIGGNICIRNGNELDFCWREAVKSLLPVCDVVSICDGESTDGTQEEIREWMKSEPKIALCVWPWPNPKGQPEWYANWINYSREHVKADWQIQLDADEVVHEKSYDEIRQFVQTPGRSGFVTRWNFWRNHRHTIPEGECLGKYVIRIAPQNLWLASDGCDARGEYASSLAVRTGVEIFHYGFIRKREQFFKKERLLQDYYFANFDPRLVAAEQGQGNWMDDPIVHSFDPVPFSGEHPVIMKEWLKERGYDT